MADAPTNRVRLLDDALPNRVRLLAEAAVIMVSPVLLAIALKKVNLKSEEHGRVVPIIMLVFAAVTLTAAICPFLIFCLSKTFCNDRSWLPLSVTNWLATSSCVCLIVLACWIIRLIISDSWAWPMFGAMFALSIVVRSVGYCRAQNAQESDHATVSKLENSLEFLSGVTALLFLGLEGLALEGQINSNQGIQSRLEAPMVSSFVACVVGVSFMLVETVPPLTPSNNNADWYGSIISNHTEIFDAIMAFAVGAVMFLITYTLVKLVALLLLAPPFLILVMCVFDATGVASGGSGSGDNNTGGDGATGVASGGSGSGDNNATAGGDGATGVASGGSGSGDNNTGGGGGGATGVASGGSGSGDNNARAGGDGATGVASGGGGGGDNNTGGGGGGGDGATGVASSGSGSGDNNAGSGGDGASDSNHGEDPKPASLELTKVTFTGFLAVSVPAISSGSVNKCTDCFLVLAAAAVVSGLVWRLLTHTKLAATAYVASFCAHLCVAIATFPFTAMAVNALS